MKDASLLWCLWNQSFKISYCPPTTCCVHVYTIILYFAKFPLCRLYWVLVKSSPSILLWWLGNMHSTFFGLVSIEANMYCYKIEWLFYEPQNFLSMVLAFSAFFSKCNAMGLSLCSKVIYARMANSKGPIPHKCLNLL